MQHNMNLSCLSLLALTIIGACSGDSSQPSDGWQLQEQCAEGASPCADMSLARDMPALLDMLPDQEPLPDQQPSDIPPGMVLIPGGSFIMGAPENFDTEVQMLNEGFPREFYLSSYAIDIHEVTVGDYKRCIDQGVCSEPMPLERSMFSCNWSMSGFTNHPVDCITWYQAQEYCQWLGKNLPTEAQWEKAARGPNGNIYPWGNSPNPNCDYAILLGGLGFTMSAGCETGHTWPVGSRPQGASVYGVMDLIGNVAELTSDPYDRDLHTNANDIDPEGSLQPGINDTRHSIRGGSFFLSSDNKRPYNSMRPGFEKHRSIPGVGFRCAKTL